MTLMVDNKTDTMTLMVDNKTGSPEDVYKLERVTYELEPGSGQYDTDNHDQMPIHNIFKAVNKLGKLEDIEQVIGIGLYTLYKALTEPIAIIQENGTIEVLWACPRFQISVDKSKCWILYGPVSALNKPQQYLLTTDYGKKKPGGWALTREELEE